MPNAISRDQIGKINDCNLIEYFRNKFGPESSVLFRNAQENFIHSMASYSMVSYYIQIKDRHNGNLLIDDSGHIIHIDFGFIFEISPANNLKFEKAEFKLLTDMVNVMGGTKDSDAFIYYREQTIKAALISKINFDYFHDIVRLNMYAGLSCFNDNSLENFERRFLLDKDPFAAAKTIDKIIDDAYNNLRTIIYDKIQYIQNRIMH